MNLNKPLVFLLVLVMLFGLASCETKEQSPPPSETPVEATPSETPEVTVPEGTPSTSEVEEIDITKVEGTLRMTTTQLSSNGQILGSAMTDIVGAQLPNLKTSVIISAGSGENAYLLADKEAELAIMTPDVSFQSMHGMEPYGLIEMYAITKTFTNQTVFAVRADSGITRMEDLVGKTVAVGATGSGPYELAKAVLESGYGIWEDIEKVYLPTSDSPSALRDGVVDAMVAHLSSGYPASYLSELDAGSVEVNYIGVSEEALAKIKESLPFEIGVEEKEGTSRLTQLEGTVLCMSNTQYIAVRPDVSEELVYAFTKALMENASELDVYHSLGTTIRPETALVGLDPNIPIHPGAARYYKEKGVWDDSLTVGTIRE
jgi:TRAP transporter TAXI family solute receptor